MAEKSPRPEEEEDAEEDGEEAAEAGPVMKKQAAEAPVLPVKEEASGPDSPPEEAPLPASPRPAACPPRIPSPPASSPGDAASSSGMNLFANDGSFLELFKKKMEATEVKEEAEERKPESRRPSSLVGKRRGGAKLALKTGMVTKKPKTEDEEVMTHKGGAWAQYMAEVKKYKAHQCSDDDKTRPLVK